MKSKGNEASTMARTRMELKVKNHMVARTSKLDWIAIDEFEYFANTNHVLTLLMKNSMIASNSLVRKFAYWHLNKLRYSSDRKLLFFVVYTVAKHSALEHSK